MPDNNIKYYIEQLRATGQQLADIPITNNCMHLK